MFHPARHMLLDPVTDYVAPAAGNTSAGDVVVGALNTADIDATVLGVSASAGVGGSAGVSASIGVALIGLNIQEKHVRSVFREGVHERGVEGVFHEVNGEQHRDGRGQRDNREARSVVGSEETF